MSTEPVELSAALATFEALWSPRIVTRVNDATTGHELQRPAPA